MSSNKNTVESTKTRKVGRKSYTQAKANARKDARRNEAEARNAKYEALTTAQKLKTVPVGGGKKQRTRLEAQLAAEKATVVPVKATTTAVTPTAKVKSVSKQAALPSPSAKPTTSSRTSSPSPSPRSSATKKTTSSKTGSPSPSSSAKNTSSKTGGSSSKR